MKTVSVLLTKYSDLISCLLYHVSGHGYTHASLGTEEENGIFYSFNYKGFCTETLERHRRRGIQHSRCYELEIPDHAYEEILQRIRQFQEHRDDYRYTRIGILFAVLRIPFHWEKHYICSQFVAELLIQSGAVPLTKDASVYLPNQFCGELEQLPQLSQIIYQPL